MKRFKYGLVSAIVLSVLLFPSAEAASVATWQRNFQSPTVNYLSPNITTSASDYYKLQYDYDVTGISSGISQ